MAPDFEPYAFAFHSVLPIFVYGQEKTGKNKFVLNLLQRLIEICRERTLPK